MIPSAPYLRHVLTLYLKMALSLPKGFVNGALNKISIATYDDSYEFVGNVSVFIRNSMDGDFFSAAGGVKNYYRVMRWIFPVHPT